MKSVLAIRIIGCNEFARLVTTWHIRTLAMAQGEKGIVSPLGSLTSAKLPRRVVTASLGSDFAGSTSPFVAHLRATFVFSVLSEIQRQA
jgi:hypothetical protein